MHDDGLLVFSYHHSKEEGWRCVAEAILGSGFVVVNSHPVKAEMSGATPKSQAKDPIQLDIIIVCKKVGFAQASNLTPQEVLDIGYQKIERLKAAGFKLSRNDERVTLYGQALTLLKETDVNKVGMSFPQVISLLAI